MVDSSFSGGPLANNHMLYREDYTSYFSTEGGTRWSHAAVADDLKINRLLLAINLSQNVRSDAKRD